MKFNPHGLRFYFAIRLTLVFMLTAAVMIYVATSYISATLIEHHRELAQVLAEEIAANSEYGFLTGDKVILGKMLEGVKRQNYVVYASIIEGQGGDGVLFEFSRDGYHPKALNGLPPLLQEETISLGKHHMIVGVTCPVYISSSPNEAESLLFEGSVGASPPKKKVLRGAVRVFLSLDNELVELGRLGASVTGGVIIGLLLLLSMLYTMLSQQVLGPLGAFIKGVREAGKGNLNYRIPLLSRSEIKELIEAFNDSLEKRQLVSNELARYQEHLEDLVKERTKELSAARNQAEDATRLKDKFVAAVSHDLRSPVASLQVLVKFIQKQPEIQSNPETSGVFAAAFKNTQGILKLIDALLDLNRIQMGKLTYHYKDCEASDIVSAAIEPLRALAEAKNIAIHVSLPPGLVIKVDENLIIQAIQNLVSNAIKYCRSGDEISLAGEQTAQGFALKVKDTGIGIRAEILAQLFSDNILKSIPGTAGEQGSGLGLQFCREIVKAHGGRITVESEVGKGTIFTVSLPSAQPL